MKPSATFWNFIAKRYAKSPVADEAAYQRKLETTRGYLTPQMAVMEFGAGTGTTAIAHAPFVKHILAVDISPKMLTIARVKAEVAKVDNITFEQSSIDAFTRPDASFDAILGLSILHLLIDREAVIAKVFGMLKPGGVFVSSTSCMDDTGGVMRGVLKVGNAVGVLPLVRFFSVAALVGDLKTAGFAIDQQWQPENSQAVFIVAKKPG
ncbi:MAG: class I SAM-dependent methyltransferase [Alphaproteobacteria bacterium]|nr:class I SAM-dependent methyltransferase [Alphaproteobacteria bacterium]